MSLTILGIVVVGMIVSFSYFGLRRVFRRISDRLKFGKCTSNTGRNRVIKLDNAAAQGAPECVICMENVATIIFIPCNHLMACKTCTDQLVDSQNR